MLKMKMSKSANSTNSSITNSNSNNSNNSTSSNNVALPFDRLRVVKRCIYKLYSEIDEPLTNPVPVDIMKTIPSVLEFSLQQIAESDGHLIIDGTRLKLLDYNIISAKCYCCSEFVSIRDNLSIHKSEIMHELKKGIRLKRSGTFDNDSFLSQDGKLTISSISRDEKNFFLSKIHQYSDYIKLHKRKTFLPKILCIIQVKIRKTTNSKFLGSKTQEVKEYYIMTPTLYSQKYQEFLRGYTFDGWVYNSINNKKGHKNTKPKKGRLATFASMLKKEYKSLTAEVDDIRLSGDFRTSSFDLSESNKDHFKLSEGYQLSSEFVLELSKADRATLLKCLDRDVDFLRNEMDSIGYKLTYIITRREYNGHLYCPDAPLGPVSEKHYDYEGMLTFENRPTLVSRHDIEKDNNITTELLPLPYTSSSHTDRWEYYFGITNILTVRKPITHRNITSQDYAYNFSRLLSRNVFLVYVDINEPIDNDDYDTCDKFV